MSKKTYVIEIDNKNIRSIISTEVIHTGDIIEDEIWFGTKVKGGKVTKVLK